MAWDMFGSKLQRHLVLKGFSPADAALSVRDRDHHAQHAVEEMVPRHPVVYSRAPAWHKQNVIAGMPRLIDGNSIAVNPYILAGSGGDLDGIGLFGNSGRRQHQGNQDYRTELNW